MENDKLPKHVAFIIDGNGRWAQKRGFPRSYGHKKGTQTLKKIVLYAKKLGIKVISIFAFSTENWKRPKDEVEYLFKLFKEAAQDILNKNKFDGICYRHMGDKNGLPKDFCELVVELEEKTKNNSDFIVNVGINYGGRDELLRTVNKILRSGKQQVSQEEFSGFLDTHGLCDPELIIRTSGEQRISNFMLYQMAYSEFYFPKVHWPDFNEKQFDKALENFTQRHRKFGGLTEDK